MFFFPILWSRWLNLLFHWWWICLISEDWGKGRAPLRRQGYTVCPSLQPSSPSIHPSPTSQAAIPRTSPDSSCCCKAGPSLSTYDAWEPGLEVMGPAWAQAELTQTWLSPCMQPEAPTQITAVYTCATIEDTRVTPGYLIFFTLWFKTILKAS